MAKTVEELEAEIVRLNARLDATPPTERVNRADEKRLHDLEAQLAKLTAEAAQRAAAEAKADQDEKDAAAAAIKAEEEAAKKSNGDWLSWYK